MDGLKKEVENLKDRMAAMELELFSKNNKKK